ncbi:MAG: hypothetical protein LLH30_07185 [Candidatus Manganitrophus sp. SA1]|nr:hypothetical protein [Candidatus Manganitrophus morganii]
MKMKKGLHFLAWTNQYVSSRKNSPVGGAMFLLFFLLTVFSGAGGIVLAEEIVGVNELNENLDQYIGKTVTVRGEVEDVYGNRSFTVDEEGILGKDLLVISDKPLPPRVGGPEETPLVLKDDTVEVTGTVRRFVATEIEREMGIDLEPQIEVEIEENRPVIVAKSITPEPQEGQKSDRGGGTE